MMSKPEQLFVIQNQDKYFLGKNSDWIDGTDLKEVFKTPHRDIAVNQLFEVNAQDYTQRIHILDCGVEGRNQPVIAPDNMPPPLPKKADPEAKTASGDAAASANPEDNSENNPVSNDSAAIDSKATEEEQAVGEDSQQQESLQEAAEIADTVEPEGELLVHEV